MVIISYLLDEAGTPKGKVKLLEMFKARPLSEYLKMSMWNNCIFLLCPVIYNA